ncbi:hypothetical protein CSA80_03760 [Candidatus Saccharibacteria bacterium]|nr:MAG: hypothetical protein CR973_01250 [Candidatus Saccharibacteria bacterium]PID99199.1 MAG: hypothetical protein CSA80_03760 [Candidatus Saccharibacteria bacterium]
MYEENSVSVVGKIVWFVVSLLIVASLVWLVLWLLFWRSPKTAEIVDMATESTSNASQEDAAASGSTRQNAGQETTTSSSESNSARTEATQSGGASGTAETPTSSAGQTSSTSTQAPAVASAHTGADQLAATGPESVLLPVAGAVVAGTVLYHTRLRRKFES